ncbi:hypothetical protein BGZ60DRAFT_413999 [Tricladium varicosporioides]|nr:hypothetical protein BGZ60DRAFT_413999 [Hymenoscyphus varicosporioides]
MLIAFCILWCDVSSSTSIVSHKREVSSNMSSLEPTLTLFPEYFNELRARRDHIPYLPVRHCLLGIWHFFSESAVSNHQQHAGKEEPFYSYQNLFHAGQLLA